MKKKFLGTEFLFRNTEFYTDYVTLDPDKWTDMQVLTQRYHTPPEEFYGGCKSIIDPMTCSLTTVHFCHSYSLFNQRIRVDESLGRSHHYKACKPSWYRRNFCNTLFKLSTRDDIMLRYEDELERSVNIARKTIFSNKQL